MSPYDHDKEYTMTEEAEDELIELFPFIPDILERAKSDMYILELLEERDIEGLSSYVEN